VSRFERLSPEHDLQSFTSGDDDLDSWLRNAAITADRAGTARVYLWIGDDEQIIGYYAVVPHGIRREDVPSSVGRGAPDVIPGFLLARLAVSEQFQRQHLGGDLLAEALTTILHAIRIAGGRVIVVDALDERAHGFYEHFGFRSLPLNDHRLVMKASTAATSLSIDWP
jgi:GNAT superfamily N-acetyltransferase